MGSYQDGIFKFIMKIPENFPDGDCPVSICSMNLGMEKLVLHVIKVNVITDMTQVEGHQAHLKAVLVNDHPLASSETNKSNVPFIHFLWLPLNKNLLRRVN